MMDMKRVKQELMSNKHSNLGQMTFRQDELHNGPIAEDALNVGNVQKWGECVKKGANIFAATCGACHVGGDRSAGTVASFSYSSANLNSGIVRSVCVQKFLYKKF